MGVCAGGAMHDSGGMLTGSSVADMKDLYQTDCCFVVREIRVEMTVMRRHTLLISTAHEVSYSLWTLLHVFLAAGHP